MLVPLSNEPRAYEWGSTTLIAQLTGRTPTGEPEAEIWFGDHPADPAEIPDGRTLDAWIAAEGSASGMPEHVPYLLKLLAAASTLSIQAHPSIAQAEAGFAREEAAGVARDAPDRTYRDANHKPELIVAVSETFRAIAGLREIEATRRLLSEIGPGADPLAERLRPADADLGAAVGWALSPDGRAVAPAIIAAAKSARSDEFAAELDLVGELDAVYPGDPGILVALLMNLVSIPRGRGLFVPAGVLHAYLSGLGVEIMAASDNVLRGGLTPKHVDVAELVAILDRDAGPAALIDPVAVGPGVTRFGVPVADFALVVAQPTTATTATVAIDGVAIALATAGRTTVTGSSGAAVALLPGEAVLATPDERTLRVSGEGQVFIAVPGR